MLRQQDKNITFVSKCDERDSKAKICLFMTFFHQLDLCLESTTFAVLFNDECRLFFDYTLVLSRGASDTYAD